MSAILSQGRIGAGHDGTALASPLPALRRRLRAWFERRVLKAQLEQLDDRALADIGISRDDIPGILAGTYRRD
jgi:uncharacterized protein YjiS (DUF1127 family)